MSEKGLAGTTDKVTTPAPTMYREVEQDENVARGHVEVIELIPYKATKEPRRYPPEKDGIIGEKIRDKEGNVLFVETTTGPYFCQDPEDILVFEENNPDVRIENFTVQVRKSTAMKYLNATENMKQFVRKGADNG